MAYYLKYYEEERKRFPELAYFVNSDVALKLARKLIEDYRLPDLPISFAGSAGASSSMFNFRRGFPGYCKIRYTNVVRASTVLHELAHYIDYIERQIEIVNLSENMDDRAKVVKSIWRKHWHGPRHRSIMNILFNWYKQTCVYQSNGTLDIAA